MRITGWSIDGFGCFHDRQLTGIPAGMSLFLGPNEAGKSTLMAFVRQMLFGFPARSSRDLKYEPLAGGRHGGRLYLETVDDIALTVERYAGKREFEARLADESLSESQLRAMLGQFDGNLFQAVYGFGLSDLQRLDGLNNADLSDRIFSAGVVGAGGSARNALDEIQKRADLLFKPRGSKAIANEIAAEIATIDRKLIDARAESQQYGDMLASRDTLVENRASIIADLQQSKRQREWSLSLIDLWPVWFEGEAALKRLLTLAPNDAIAAEQVEITDLQNSLSRYREWNDRLAGLGAQFDRDSLQVQREISDLGPGWTVDRVRQTDVSQLQSTRIGQYEAELEELGRMADEAERRVRERCNACDEQKLALQDEEAHLATLDEPWTREEIERGGLAVQQLRADQASLANARLQLDAGEQQLALAGRHLREFDLQHGSSLSLVAILAALLAAAAGIGAGLLYTGEETSYAIVAGLLALASLAAVIDFWWTSRQHEAKWLALRGEFENAEAGAAVRHSEQTGGVWRMEQSIDVIASSMALDVPPVQRDIEYADDFVKTETLRRHDYDRVAMYLSRAREQLRKLEASLEQENLNYQQSLERLTAGKQEWNDWRNQHLAVSDLNPESARLFLGELRDRRRNIASIDSQVMELQVEQAQIDTWNRRVAELVLALGGDQSATPEQSVESMTGALDHDDAVRQEQRELKRTVEMCEGQLTTRFGADESASALRDRLATGAVDSWKDELQETDQQIEALEGEREAVIRECTLADDNLARIAASFDIPEMEQRKAALAEDLRRSIEEWQELQIAAGLIRKTLETYERDRQPAVLRTAGDLYRQVTGGRFQRIYRPLDEAGSLRVEDRAGASRAPEALSRGSLEQLYLCVRLGLAASFADRVGSLPMLMDDVMVNFDPGRAEAVAKILAETATRQQLLVFTCHPETARMVADVAPGTTLFEMGYAGEGAAWNLAE